MHLSIHYVESIELKETQKSVGDAEAIWRSIVITDDRGAQTEVVLFADDALKL